MDGRRAHRNARLSARASVAAAATYFGLVFGAGFLLGAIRVPFVVPRVGERYAELAEMPLMFVAVYLAAGYVVRKFSLPASGAADSAGLRGISGMSGGTRVLVASRGWWAVGLMALGLLVLAELLLAVVLAGRSVADYLASRDPVSGGGYLAMLGVFAAMPQWRSARIVPAEPRAAVAFTGGATAVLLIGLAGYLAPLNPGVLSLQLAFSPRVFGTIVHLWPADHLARYRLHLPFDCLLLVAYGAFGYLLATRTRVLAGLGRSLRIVATWTLPVAAAFDLVENGLHWWLTEAPRFGVPGVYAIAATAASLKWGLVLAFGASCTWSVLTRDDPSSGPKRDAED